MKFARTYLTTTRMRIAESRQTLEQEVVKISGLQ